jgi:hypothetical protein
MVSPATSFSVSPSGSFRSTRIILLFDCHRGGWRMSSPRRLKRRCGGLSLIAAEHRLVERLLRLAQKRCQEPPLQYPPRFPRSSGVRHAPCGDKARRRHHWPSERRRASWLMIVRKSVRRAGSLSSPPPSSAPRAGRCSRIWLASHRSRVRLSGVRTPRSASRPRS